MPLQVSSTLCRQSHVIRRHARRVNVRQRARRRDCIAAAKLRDALDYRLPPVEVPDPDESWQAERDRLVLDQLLDELFWREIDEAEAASFQLS